MTSAADTLVLEQLWQAIQPLPPIPPRRYSGRLAATRGPVPVRRMVSARRPGVWDRGGQRYGGRPASCAAARGS
jgi:hypothetical protein